MAGKRGAALDPARKLRVIQAALRMVTAVGVRKVTYRNVAEEAAVPLGSLTYHFENLDSILEGAFGLLAESMSKRYDAGLKAAQSENEAIEAVVDLICGDSFATQEELIALYEMYVYARRNRKVGRMLAEWLQTSRRSLSKHFSDHAARAIDALVEAWPMHQSFEGERLSRVYVAQTIAALAHQFPKLPDSQV